MPVQFHSEIRKVNVMNVGVRLRSFREERAMSQGDVEKVTGLLRRYTSRLENGHTFPSVETLEKYAAAFNVPLYRFFYDGDEPVPLPQAMPGEDLEELATKPGKKGSEARFFLKLKKLLVNVDERDREVFLALVRKLAAAKK